jgi:hypothetical protein
MDHDAAAALSGFDDFAGVYTSTTHTPQPWFRRRNSSTPSDSVPGTE